MFHLSKRSLRRLNGVNPQLQSVVKRAIEISKVDFGVTEGLRTLERQKQLMKEGVTRTIKSKHLIGRAVDLVAYIDGRVTWELEPYFKIADAMTHAAYEMILHAELRWGGAWTVANLQTWEGTSKEAHEAYVAWREQRGRKPFIDAPHFEINRLM